METDSTRLTKPYKNANVLDISQGFHAKHKAIDWVKTYGTPIVAPENVRIDEVICDCRVADGPSGIERGFGLHMTGLESGFKYTYWHLWPYAPVWANDQVQRGKIIAFMGNSGNVNTGGHYVPLSDRNAPPFRGTHLHQAVYDTQNTPVDPLLLTDLWIEPTYSTSELIAAWVKTLTKMGKLAFR